MKLERGHIYEVDNGWGYLRATKFTEDYESFNPDVVEGQYVHLIRPNGGQPFKMERSQFEKLALEDHGFHIPDEPSHPERSHDEHTPEVSNPSPDSV